MRTTPHQQRQRDPSPLVDEQNGYIPVRDEPAPSRRERMARMPQAEPSGTETERRVARAQSMAPRYRALLRRATAQKFMEDYQKALTNTSSSSHTNFSSDDHQSKVIRSGAHAAVIEGGVFGVEAVLPCSSCSRNGTLCLVYHPSMHLEPWKSDLKGQGKGSNNKHGVGESCSECRKKDQSYCDANRNPST